MSRVPATPGRWPGRCCGGGGTGPGPGRPGPARTRAGRGPAGTSIRAPAQQVETAPSRAVARRLAANCSGASAAADAAGQRRRGGRLATSPVRSSRADRQPRYQQMAEAFGLTAQEQLTCGCHVHVAVASDEEGVAALDRIQPWLAPLLALSANSPFWHGTDSSYASFRYQAWGRWPCAGPTEWFGSARAYQQPLRIWWPRGRCWTPAWCTSTPGCPSVTRPWRYGSPTCACGPRMPP